MPLGSRSGDHQSEWLSLGEEHLPHNFSSCKLEAFSQSTTAVSTSVSAACPQGHSVP
ncbi:MAG: hypothetical protein AAF063_38330 [Cyanobacteria bacterium J06643_5]